MSHASLPAPAPPTIAREPRNVPPLPGGTIEVPTLPPTPVPPRLALPSLVMPLFFSLAFVGAVVLAVRTLEPFNVLLALLACCIAAVTSIPPALGYALERRRFGSASRERVTTYQAVLAHARAELTRRRQQQQDTTRQIDPDPAECLSRVERRDRRLWERSPGEADFLAMRVGTGPQPFATTVRTSFPVQASERDPLAREAARLQSEFAAPLIGPVLLPLGRARAVAYTGDRQSLVEAARALAVQIATHHAPDEVKIAAIYPPSETAEWAWLRWLPHTWAEGREHRYLAGDPRSAHQLLASLNDVLERRRQASRLGRPHEESGPPTLVCFLADPDLCDAVTTFPRLFDTDPAGGVVTIWFGEAPRQVPITVQLAPNRAQLVPSDPATPPASFEPDRVPLQLAEQLARSMAPLRPERSREPEDIAQQPQRALDLATLLGVDRVDLFDVLGAWRESQTRQVLDVTLGLAPSGGTVSVPIEVSAGGSNCQHILIGGAAGSGKTQMLRGVVGALAARHHPHDLSFILVTASSNGLFEHLADLPHVTDCLAGEWQDGRQDQALDRLLAAVSAELARRRATAAGQVLQDGRRSDRVSQLIVVVDDVDALVDRHPRGDEIRRRIADVARQSGGLGVHLVLAAQDPAVSVAALVGDPRTACLALRMGSSAASRALIGSDLAYSTTGTATHGRGYLRAAGGSAVEPLVTAWADAPQRSNGRASERVHEVAAVGLDGTRRSPRLAQAPEPAQASSTQLAALVARIAATARQAGVGRLPKLLSGPVDRL
ncbi:MAG: FtsK/SpoIIIE domain-containing protein [Chloroflexota bacterium]